MQCSRRLPWLLCEFRKSSRSIPTPLTPLSLFLCFLLQQWKNLNDGPLNQMPRLGGEFLYRQLYNARKSGANVIYGAMCESPFFSLLVLNVIPTLARPSPASLQSTNTTRRLLSCPRSLYLPLFQRNAISSLSTPTEKSCPTTGTCEL